MVSDERFDILMRVTEGHIATTSVEARTTLAITPGAEGHARAFTPVEVTYQGWLRWFQ